MTNNKITDADIDSDSWEDEETAFRCKALRSPIIFTWCGYVVIPGDSPLFSALSGGIFSPIVSKLDVHGGITFNETDTKGNRVIGFDCGHFLDAWPFELIKKLPGMKELAEKMEKGIIGAGSYKDINFVKEELAKLAKQLKKLEDELKAEEK